MHRSIKRSRLILDYRCDVKGLGFRPKVEAKISNAISLSNLVVFCELKVEMGTKIITNVNALLRGYSKMQQ